MEIENLCSHSIKLLHCHLNFLSIVVHVMNCSGFKSEWLVCVIAVSTVTLCHFSACFSAVCVIVLLLLLFYSAKHFASLLHPKITFWPLCTSTFLAQDNTCSLVLFMCFLFECSYLSYYLGHHIIIYAINELSFQSSIFSFITASISFYSEVAILSSVFLFCSLLSFVILQ